MIKTTAIEIARGILFMNQMLKLAGMRTKGHSSSSRGPAAKAVDLLWNDAPFATLPSVGEMGGLAEKPGRN
jgi:hypothetical protein